ncbi:MAG: ABC transporter permease [Breznakia sp.]
MSIDTILGAIELGLIFAIMSYGIYITFKILNFPDLTVDGSFTLGGVVSASLALQNHSFLGLVLAMLAGAFAGLFTGFLHTKMKVQYILAGIITMTGLYSINLKIGKTPNLSLYGKDTIFTSFSKLLTHFNLPRGFVTQYHKVILLFMIVVLLGVLLYIFFKTQIGLAIRATGNNEAMVRASSINTDAMKMLGLTLANAFVALSAGIYTQHQMFYDISQGIGMMVVGLTSIIVGESIFGKRSILHSFVSLILGAVLYRLLLAFALSLGMEASDWKLLSAALVAILISIPTMKQYVKKKQQRTQRRNTSC